MNISAISLPKFSPKHFLPLLFIVFASLLLKPQTAHAACAALDTTNGTATQTVNIPAAGTYTIWSRIKTPDTTNNSYYLEIDNTTICGTNVGDSASIPANTWTWVDYKDGNSATKVTATLTAGNHSIRMVGREGGVQLDRVLFLLNPCTPTGTGDNCAVTGDIVAPTIALTAPASGATVSGSTTISANATDDTAVSKVDFLVDGIVVNSDTSAPYSYAWDTTGASQGSHTIAAKAFDAAGNNTSTTPISVTVNNVAPTPDLVVTAVSWTPASPVSGNAVSFSATIKNQGAAATAAGTIHSIRFSVDGTPVTLSDNTTSSLAAGASRTQTANAPATWAATTGTHTVLAYVDEVNRITESNEANNTLSASISVAAPPDTTAPAVSLVSPTNGATLSSSATISASATDNSGTVSKVEFLIDGNVVNSDTAAPYSYTWDTTTASQGAHTIVAKAYDPSNNIGTSTTVNVTVDNVVPKPDLIVTGVTWTPASPAAGNAVTFSATIKNQGTVATAGVVHSVQFSVDGTAVSLSNNNSTPLAVGASRTQTANAPATWTATGGTHTVTAYVDNSTLIAETNEANNTLASSITVTNPDTTAPTVSITSPTNGATVTNIVTITATASDNIGVSRVDLYRGSTLMSSDTTTPYSYSWDTTALTNGAYALTAKAYDAAGNSTTSSAINVTVNNIVIPPPDTTPPSTSITSPTNGATVAAAVNVTASAADNVGVSKVELYIDGSLVATDFAASYIFNWDTSGFSNGSHVLTTKAYDAAGNTGGSTAVNVTVNNAPPPGPKPGDVNGDNKVDVFDASIMLYNWGKSGQTRAQGDLNGDGTVNVFDASIMLFNWGK